MSRVQSLGVGWGGGRAPGKIVDTQMHVRCEGEGAQSRRQMSWFGNRENVSMYMYRGKHFGGGNHENLLSLLLLFSSQVAFGNISCFTAF